MFFFLIRWIIVSILVSLLAAWLKIVPAYPKRVYTLLVHLLDTAVLTIVLTIILTFGIYPSWVIVAGLIIMSLIFSVWLINHFIRGTGEETGKSTFSKLS